MLNFISSLTLTKPNFSPIENKSIQSTTSNPTPNLNYAVYGLYAAWNATGDFIPWYCASGSWTYFDDQTYLLFLGKESNGIAEARRDFVSTSTNYLRTYKLQCKYSLGTGQYAYIWLRIHYTDGNYTVVLNFTRTYGTEGSGTFWVSGNFTPNKYADFISVTVLGNNSVIYFWFHFYQNYTWINFR